MGSVTRPTTAVGSVRAHGARAWFWALDYAYVLGWQASSVVRPVDPARYAEPPGPRRSPVLVLPGVLETWDFLRPVVEVLYSAGHPIHAVTDLGRNRGPVPEMAERVERYLEDRDLMDVVVVAHSKGGLIGKYVMARDRCGARVAAMVTINTPFGGSTHARFIPTPTIRIFLPEDPTLRALAAAVEVNARISSIASRWDPHIPDGSYLPGARNLVVPVDGHFRILGDRRLVAAVLDAVARADMQS